MHGPLASRGQHLTGERSEQRHSHRVDIGPRVDRPAGALLGRHVIRRTGQQCFVQFGIDVLNQSKVQQDHATVFSHQHIRWLNVAMQLAHFMKGVDTFRELA